MPLVIYLTPADYDAALRAAQYEFGRSVATISSIDDIPIINEKALAKLNMPVPDKSTFYEIESVG